MRNHFQSIAIKKEALATLIVLIGIAVAAPALFKQQLITGTIINATLILGASLLGARDALLIGLIPSSTALAAGLLSPALAPMIPFIIIGNAILVLTFVYLKNINFWAGVVVGSLLKFGFLYGTSTVVSGWLLDKQLAPAMAQVLNWPQLITALCGGTAAFVVLKFMKKEWVTH